MKNWFNLIVLMLLSNIALAQYCNPQGDCTRRDYINNFTFNTISRLNSAGSNCGTFRTPGPSYVNTGLSTTVTQGKKYAMSVRGRTGGATQGFGIWIDFNKDNDFNDAGEFVSSNTNPTNQTFNDSILIPISAKAGTTRMRVRSLRSTAIKSRESCTTFNRGETEDYTLIVQDAPIPPITDFKANTTVSCNGIVNFTDLTPNKVTSWLWEFGDGDTSHKQNPTHTYVSGTYTVKLTATNTFGSKAESKTNYITVNLGSGTISAQCTPVSSSSAGFGITSFSFSSLANTSQDATVGYEDFSCTQTPVTQGLSYQMKFGSLTALAKQNFRAWIDYNGDGVFSTQEMVLSQDNVTEAKQMVTIPSNSTVGSALRVRIAGVYFLTSPSGSAFTSCVTLNNGQMEDYNVIIKKNTVKPIANLEAVPPKSCDGIVQFNDISQNLPSKWEWDFGDGSKSSLEHPKHTYTADGTYSIRLKVTNAFGTDSTTKASLVTVNLKSQVKAACASTSTSHIDDYGIKYVIFNTINNITTDAREGYQDYSCSHQTLVDTNTKYSIEIKTGSLNLEDVSVWIDYDNDGVFNNTNEKVLVSVNDTLHRDTITIPSASIKFKALRMRVISDIVGTNIKSCGALTYGQTEDYGVIIRGDSIASPAPLADFSADTVKSCTGVIQFTDNSTNTPNQWEWDFGDATSSIIKNPKHTYGGPGKYTVKLTTTNSFGSNLKVKTAYIDVDDVYCGATSLKQIALSQIQVYPNPSEGLVKISFPISEIKNYELEIISLQGQIIYLNSLNSNDVNLLEIDISNQEGGIYLLKVSTGNNQIIKKVIIK